MKSLIKITVLLVVLISFTSCKKDSRPNYQYFPNMYAPVSYEAYGESKAFANGVEAQLPAEGSIARGHIPFDVDNTNEGYADAKANLKTPLEASQIDLKRGGELYNIYCAICHGTKGDGQGTLVKREKILGVPQYNDIGRAITEGSIYHTIHYGKNAMGSYANQLNFEERWQVVAYVINLKRSLDGLEPIDYKEKSESIAKTETSDEATQEVAH
jgi:mono/diheme cytochrome c family protein